MYNSYYRPSHTNIVLKLILINFVVFVIELLTPNGYMIYYFGLIPRLVIGKYYYWQVFTYMFLHGGWMHIFFNMFALYIFGIEVEHYWGGKKFLEYYLICGVGAGIISLLTYYNSPIPIIGASGAIYGVVLAYGLLFPERYLYLYFFIPIKAKYLVIMFILFEFFAGISGGGDHIAHFAHLGGLLTGFIYLKWPLIKSKLHIRKSVIGGNRNKWRDNYNEYDSEVDIILKKASKYGVDSLTPDEIETLRKARNK
ncbi:MAG: rhomboid family intramembrane serine protease [Proteobacteria bacterium]|nr:rhomboid family intramembrane serine protease [Pseudomonadota bacterium]